MFSFKLYRFALPGFLCFQSIFSPSFSRRFFLHYISYNLCIKTTLKVVTVSRETGDKTKKTSVLRALLCYNARSVTNHIADFALLIL